MHRLPPDLQAARLVASGVRSKVFVSSSGTIIRRKPLWLGTYAREALALNYIWGQGGIGCAIPQLRTFIHGVYAYSEHAGIDGETFNSQKFNLLDEGRKKMFAQRLADALLRLHELGKEDCGREWSFRPRKHGWAYCFARWLNIRHHIRWKDFLAWGREVRRFQPGGWVHNDLHGKNIIVTPEGDLAGLIDFDGVMQGPFEYNLRKMEKPLRDLVMEHCDRVLQEGGQTQGVNRYAANYYRVMVLAQKLRTASNGRREQLTQELLGILHDRGH
jgi:hypothetical protein